MKAPAWPAWQETAFFQPQRLVVAFWILLTMPCPALAQLAAFQETMVVEVNSTAARRLSMLDDFLADKQWDEAINAAQTLVEEFGDELVADRLGSLPALMRYRPVSALCRDRLDLLPPEAMRRYQTRVNPQAERWWKEYEATRNPEWLDRIVDRAWPDSRCDDALRERGLRAWKRADFAEARTNWQLLLKRTTDHPPSLSHEPTTSADLAAWIVITVLAEGRPSRARSEFERFRERYPASEGTLGGVRRPWVEHLQTLLDGRFGEVFHVPVDDTQTLGATAARTGRFARSPDVGGRQWSLPLEAVPLRRYAPRRGLNRPLFQDDAIPFPSQTFPATAHNLVFYQTADGIHARDLATGEPAWAAGVPGHSDRIYPPGDPTMVPPLLPCAGSAAYSIALQKNRLFARLGWPVGIVATNEPRPQIADLICLDIGNGQGLLRWKVSDSEIPHQDGGWHFAGPPLVLDHAVHMVLCRSQSLLDLAVVSFDADTGALRWVRTLGHARVVAEANVNLLTHLVLTADHRRLFLSTDLGAVFALNADTGRLAWVCSYPSTQAESPVGRVESTPVSPPVASSRCVYVAPSDSNEVHCFRAEDGSVVWSHPRPEPLRHLLGIADGLLFASGRSLQAFSAETGTIAWRLTQTEPEDYGAGRGLIAGEMILWPARESLWIVDIATGEPRRIVRPGTPENPHPRVGGNLALSHSRLIIGDNRTLTIYGKTSHLPLIKTDLERDP